MCGLCGFTGIVQDKVKVIKKMTKLMTHRGPDSVGYFADNFISMGFRRLSIIDIKTGEQPIYNENNNFVINFNGEIYNYKELKEELISKNHKFYTKTDSEVIVHGFEEYGEDVLNKLRGMFAFSIFNRQEKSVFLARDFFGIKPLYYCNMKENFVYASEIKSILVFPELEKKFNYKALDNYLSFQYSVPPETFFENIYSLLPGEYLYFKNGEVAKKKYFKPLFNINDELGLKESVENIEKIFEDSVNKHKISDVEVGCFLSSGIDSSYVASYFSGQKAFTVGFDSDEKYNEVAYAERFSDKFNLEHHVKIISEEEYWSTIKKVQYFMDQPLADPSCVALYFVCKEAHEHVKVVLSGEGADELFGGYSIYNESKSLNLYQKILPEFIRKILAKIAKKLPFYFKGRGFIIRGEKTLEDRFIGNAFIFTKEEKDKILKKPEFSTDPKDFCKKFYDQTSEYDNTTKMQYLDMNLWLVGDILLKADRMSMANSLELRVPFLDKEVFKIASSLPKDFRVNKLNTKYALRLAASKRLPKETAEKKKLGFPVPIRDWIKMEKYFYLIKNTFESDASKKFFNTEKILKLLEDHYDNKWDNSRKIWTIYTFLLWYNIYFEEFFK
ncbi:MAG: asparagine synthase (glutamine-hydrolyzing) [Candidatus Paraimprobicoccus trichonymphae]|uniref:asparagine synthase (glutamine-hydrolyzing) n=1 Tax=Candidatus Paraimprobicoccus trichonymphae TaxID=3033793 RepID=A0AA48IHG0_9FIRM|nr:MAG: asparagine synthase (glutamine-hydrolyzing) [Candidatus Paraimprobicoccus trichonymphae]